MSKTAKPIYPQPPRTVLVEPDSTASYWSNTPDNTLPPPDMIGIYQRHRPLALRSVGTGLRS
jgi:oleate hydratase